MSRATVITLRPATAVDTPALYRLAALDSADPPRRPVVVAEADGELLAARSLRDGHAVADPFSQSAGLLDLLAQWVAAARATV